MESNDDVEVLSRAIEKLLDEKRKREAAGDAFIEDHDDQLLFTRLISQLESPETKRGTDGTTKEKEEGKQSSDSLPWQGKHESDRRLEESLEEIAKDIKNMKRQNTITHVLLSAMIFLTLAWQLSEYSMIFMMKQRITHPIRSIGGMLNGMFKGKFRPIKYQLTGSSTSTSREQDNDGNGTNTGATIQMPDLFREFGFDDDEE